MIEIRGAGKIASKKNRTRLATVGGKARAFKHKDVVDFEKMLQQLAHISMRGREPIVSNVCMYLDVVFGDNRARDLQNCFGSICDALNGIVYVDDSQIVKIVASKVIIKNEWSFRIKVEEL